MSRCPWRIGGDTDTPSSLSGPSDPKTEYFWKMSPLLGRKSPKRRSNGFACSLTSTSNFAKTTIEGAPNRSPSYLVGSPNHRLGSPSHLLGSPNHRLRKEIANNARDNTGLRRLTNQQQRSNLFGKYHEPASELAQLQRSPLAPLAKQRESDRLVPHYTDLEENYAMLQSQDVTHDIYNCIRIVEGTTEVAATTMEKLHEQGRQIPRSHRKTLTVMEEVHEGEKVLGSFGGLFSRRWKPKKGHRLKGPREEPHPYQRKTVKGYGASKLRDNTADARNQLQRKANTSAGLSGTQLQLEMEREHQDQALSKLGDMLDNLKDMSFEMGSEVKKQTAALGDMEQDVDTVRDRVRQAYYRARYLSRF